MSGLKLYDYEEAFIQIEPQGKKYFLVDYTAELAGKITKYDEKAKSGDRDAMDMQLHLLTGIPIETLKTMAQWKINEMSKYCVTMNIERKKKEKEPKKSK